MTNILLFAAPGTCARVPSIILEELEVPFEVKVVRFMKAEHKSPEYKKYNPKGKVPALVIGEETLTENVAIINYLAQTYPTGTVMPLSSGALDTAHQIADLCFCSATLHPLVTRIRMPQFFSAPEAARSVWTAGCEAMMEYFQLIEDRMVSQQWWYGETWSAMDAYLYWVFWRVEGANFDTSLYPHYCDHARRMEQRPAVQRALAREAKMEEYLVEQGLLFTPPPLPSS
jgi:glutathione S-transferase